MWLLSKIHLHEWTYTIHTNLRWAQLWQYKDYKEDNNTLHQNSYVYIMVSFMYMMNFSSFTQ